MRDGVRARAYTLWEAGDAPRWDLPTKYRGLPGIVHGIAVKNKLVPTTGFVFPSIDISVLFEFFVLEFLGHR